MSVIPFPTSIKSRDAQIIARTVVGSVESQFTFSTQIQKHAGERWEFVLTYPPMTNVQAGEFLAFLLRMNGKLNTTLVPDPDRIAPQGIGTGTPLINGSAQTGNSIITDGWTVSQTGILKAGDLLQIGNYMYMVLQDANSDSGGNATFNIWPSLRSSPADDASIIINNCATLCRLASNNMEWNTNNLSHYGITISFVESLPTS